MATLALVMAAITTESAAITAGAAVALAARVLDDTRLLRGRTDLLDMPRHEPGAGRAAAAPSAEAATPAAAAPLPAAAEHDSCRVGSLTVSEPVTVEAIWEAARRSFNGGNNRGCGNDFAGFSPT